MDLYKSRTVQRAADSHRQDKLAYYHGFAESCFLAHIRVQNKDQHSVTGEMLEGPEEIINAHGRLFPTDIVASIVRTMEFKL